MKIRLRKGFHLEIFATESVCYVLSPVDGMWIKQRPFSLFQRILVRPPDLCPDLLCPSNVTSIARAYTVGEPTGTAPANLRQFVRFSWSYECVDENYLPACVRV